MRRGGERMSESKKRGGGRFSGETAPGFARFNRSFGFDRRLFEADVRGSLAHCEGLRAAGVVCGEEGGGINSGARGVLARAASEAAAIRSGLRELLARAEREGESFFADESAEDVHSFIESRLIALVGDAGRR